MTITPRTPLDDLCNSFCSGESTPTAYAEQCLERANSNASRNTYLHLDPQQLIDQAHKLSDAFPTPHTRPPLYGVPVSLKDCFDLAGTVATMGTRFYAQHRPVAIHDSAVAERLRALGCIITGKTHLHPLAYGITGENPEFGDCLQPRDASLLTGGSSSGAAASVQEGSALFAIGTDTGGSVRVPAALCGLAGFRASQTMPRHWPQMWRGGIHLAPSFDTLGFFTRDARDLEAFARALFDLPPASPRHSFKNIRIGVVASSFLDDADTANQQTFLQWQQTLHTLGCTLQAFDPALLHNAFDIFAPIQASEAAAIHRGHFEEFESSIADRLRWGDSLSEEELQQLRRRHEQFRHALNAQFTRFDFLMLPASPRSELRAGADHSSARAAILRYTTPFSLGGNPVAVLSGEMLQAPRGTGVQIAAAPGCDSSLLAFISSLAQRIAQPTPSPATPNNA